MESITVDNLQSINDKCNAIKNMLEIEFDSNVKQLQLQKESNFDYNDSTQQLNNQFLKIIDIDPDASSRPIEYNRLSTQESSKDGSPQNEIKLKASIEEMQLKVSNLAKESYIHPQ